MNENAKSKTGKALEDITIENILNGSITSEDIKISAEALKRQGQTAEGYGRVQLKRNFDRASELIQVPDDFILKIYEMLRPNRATKDELLTAAMMLKNIYNAKECSNFIINAVKVYEKRGILRPEGE